MNPIVNMSHPTSSSSESKSGIAPNESSNNMSSTIFKDACVGILKSVGVGLLASTILALIIFAISTGAGHEGQGVEKVKGSNVSVKRSA